MYQANYNFLDKFLHRLALGSSSIAELTFEINHVINKNKLNTLNNNQTPIFVSGLARSGTTALMNLLFNTNQFTSLSYNEMPFVLAPNLWSKVKTSKTSEFIERAHKDGIFINNKSPEALDEVFWKVFLENNYIKNDHLIINDIPSKILLKFERYIDLVLLNQKDVSKRRYLSKNNNNILRVDKLKEHFPNATFIVPFRNPIDHAASLLNQHKLFSLKQQEDSFILNYMNWIGHYEFGLNHKPFYFNDNLIFNELKKYESNSINYWLLIWLNYYTYILKNKHLSEFILVDYDTFLNDPTTITHKLFDLLKIKSENSEIKKFNQKEKNEDFQYEIDSQINERCNRIYHSLKSTNSLI